MRRFVLTACAFFALALTGDATTVKPLDDDALYAGAQRVFHGVCTEARGELDASGRAVTRYRFSVTEGFKGSPATSVELLQPGGTFAGRTLVIPGVARFRAGEEAVVFIGKACPKTGCAFTVGLSQGKFRVKRGKKDVVVRDFNGLQFGKQPAPTKASRPLAPFLAALRKRRK